MRHRKTCKNGIKCKFNSTNICEFKHDPKHLSDNNVETSEIVAQTKSLKQEIKNLKSTNANKLKELAYLKYEIQHLQEKKSLQDEIQKENNSLKNDNNRLKEKVRDTETRLKEEEVKVKTLHKTNSELETKLDRVCEDNFTVSNMEIKLEILQISTEMT